MKKFTSPLTFSISKLKRSFALIILFSCILSLKVISQSARLDQWQKGLAKWEFGNLNRRHSNYTEGQSVPYRIFISGLTPDEQATLLITFDITGASHDPVKHGIDYLTNFGASFPDPPIGPFDDATVYGDIPGGGFVIPDILTLEFKPIPAPSNLSFLGGVSQGDMLMLGGTIDLIEYATPADEGDPTKKNQKATITVTFTPNTQFAVFFFGGHLAEDGDYPGDDNGAGGIHGSPYHMTLGNITGTESRSVQVGLDEVECDLPIEGSCEPDAKCETTAGGGTAHFDLTLCSSIGSDYTGIAWYDPNDDPIVDPTDFVASDGDIVYAVLSNGCGLSEPIYVTLHVNALPTVTCPGNSNVCISDPAFALTGATPTDGTYSGAGVSGGIFTPTDAGLGSHTIIYTYSDGNSCSNSCSFTITVNDLPTFGTITSTATCSGTSNGTITLASCADGVSYQLQTCSGYNRQDPKTCNNGSVTWNGLAAGSYKIVATITATGCSKTSGCVTLVGSVCNNTLTQGFYGNLGGKDCNGKAALDIMKPAIGVGNSVKFGNQAAGAAGCKSFTLKYTDLTTSDGNKLKIFRMLPGGTTPSVLGCSPSSCSYTAYYDCAASWTYVTIQASGSAKGSLNNVLLAQTMTLFFNLYNSATLGSVQLTGNKLTFNNLACGSSTPGTYASTQYIPCSVLNYLSNTSNYASPTIANLYDLANKVLGGIVTTISASDINAALNAINVGFDKGKALMSQEITCPPPVTRASSQILNEVVAQNPVVTAYPNPFNDQVRFILQSTEPGKATLEVYNMVGQKVKTVFQGPLFANTPQTVEYKVPALSPTQNLIYIFRINGKQFTGKLINIRN